MQWWNKLDLGSIDWITPTIHAYAGIVGILTLLVYFVHRSRLSDLARRIGTIAAQIEGGSVHANPVRLDQMTGLIAHLGDIVERRSDLDIRPVLEFLRREERQRSLLVVANLVNITETMIELFPMLGIFGTVWGISGVGREQFSSDNLLFLFGVATRTTLWALLYVIVFRIMYSAFVQAKVMLLEAHLERFGWFLAILEARTSLGEESVKGLANAPSVASGSLMPGAGRKS